MGMGFIHYNGVDIEIRKTRIIARDFINSEDGSTYLYTRWTFDILGVVNPKALSYDSGGAKIDGIPATDTDWNIRQRLRTHRRKLVYSVGDTILLTSPVLPATVDANNGPIVEKCDIVEFGGEKTIMWNFRVVTFVNDCASIRSGSGDKASIASLTTFNPVISHRWRRFDDIDQDHYSCLVTEGSVVFDTALLNRIGTVPDQYRGEFLHPIPFSFKRESIHVAPDSDGTTLYYRVTDRQMPYNIETNGWVTRAECYHTRGWARTGAIETALRAAHGVVGAALDLRLGSAASAGMGAILGQVPRHHSHCISRVWGNRFANARHILYTAIGIVLHRMNWGGEGDTTEFVASIDPLGRWAEASMTVTSGINRLFTELTATAPRGIESVANDLLSPTEDIVFSWVPLFTDGVFLPAGDNVAFSASKHNTVGTTYRNHPPESRNSRGTWPGVLLHQILASAPCEKPAKPLAHPVWSRNPYAGENPDPYYLFPDKTIPTT